MRLEFATSRNTQLWGSQVMSFGQRIRTMRTKQGITAKELSARSGVPEKTIYRIETEEVSDPKLSTVEPLVRALNCTADEILFDSESFSGDQRLRKLFEATSQTSKGNQELVVQLISKLNMADTLQWEVLRHQIEPLIDNPNATRTETGNRLTWEDFGLPADAVEYFKKNPTSDYDAPPDED